MQTSLKCIIEAVNDSCHLGDPVLVRGVLTNTSARHVQVLVWNTFLEGAVKGNYVEVAYNGTKVGYDGPRLRRFHPGPSSYRRLGPGESVDQVVDVSSAYAFEGPGDYTLRFSLPINDFFTEGESSRDAFRLTSNTLALQLQPAGQPRRTSGQVAREREPRSAPVPLERTVASSSLPPSPKNPTFHGATSDQQSQLLTAHHSAYQAILAAIHSPDVVTGGTLYRRWFGAPSQTRQALVSNNYYAMAQWMATNTITYDCTCFSSKGCDDPNDKCCDWDEVAYTYPGTTTLYPCSVFFWFITPVDEQAETIVHEVSHQAVDTDDGVTSQAVAMARAMVDPDKAVDSAYNYGYFAAQEYGGPNPSANGMWNGHDRQLGDESVAAPACAFSVSENALLMVYQDHTKGRPWLWTRGATVTTSKTNWGSSHPLPSKDANTKFMTCTGAAIAENNGTFYCVYPQGDSSQSSYQSLVLITTTDQGSTWSSPAPLGVPVSGPGSPDPSKAPAVAFYGNTLYCTYVDAAGTLYWVSGTLSGTSVSWASAHSVGYQSLTSPALCVFQGQLYCAYFGAGSTLRVTTFGAGFQWSSEQNFAINQSSAGPGLAVWNTTPPRLVCRYRGVQPDTNLRDFAFDGTQWDMFDYRESGLQSQYGPALASAGSVMNALYIGGKNDHVYWGTSKTDV